MLQSKGIGKFYFISGAGLENNFSKNGIHGKSKNA